MNLKKYNKNKTLNILIKIKYLIVFLFILLITVLYCQNYNLNNIKTSIKKNLNYFSTQSSIKQSNKFKPCVIPKIKTTIDNSYAFIGHAYGSPNSAKNEDFIASSVNNFILQNSNKINSVIFTGDIFFVPSISKWKKLEELSFDTNINFFIAPGNHDIYRPDSNDVFKTTIYGQKKYPYLINLENTPLILDNSIQTNWIVSDQLITLVNNTDTDALIIARHNLPIRDLLFLVNSKAGMSEQLNYFENLKNKFKKNKKIYWVIGDGGAFETLPRLSCLTNENHTFIINGLGEVDGDSVLLYVDNNFFEYTL